MIPTDKLHWRKAELKDAEAVIAMVNGAYRGDSGRQGWTTESDLLDGQRLDRELLNDLYANREGQLLIVASSDAPDKLIGCVYLERKHEGAYLGLLTVDVQFQAGGVGSYLMKAAEEFISRDWQKKSVFMTVISVRQELIHWYERKGYKRTGETKPFPYGDQRFGIPRRPDLEFIVLEKRL